jgi:predicted RNA binding protein YcfA (HicA-like mRNA interferase family)
MPKLPLVSGAKAVKARQRLGFFVDRQRGSHVVMKKITIEGERGCVIPMHKKSRLAHCEARSKWPGFRRKNSLMRCDFQI